MEPRNSRKGERVMAWVLFLSLVAAGLVQAGRGDKSGTPSAAQLLIPVGTRSIALGGASLASVQGLEALYWNPAGFARLEKHYAAAFSHMSYLADIGVDYVGLGMALGDGSSFGLTVKALSIGDIPVTTEDEPDGTGELTSPRFMTIGTTFARRISERISAGVTANLVYEKMGNVVGTTFAFNAGVQYTGLGGIDGLAVGVVVKNIGPQLAYDGSGLERVVTVETFRPRSRWAWATRWPLFRTATFRSRRRFRTTTTRTMSTSSASKPR
jgi:hypothetical protein